MTLYCLQCMKSTRFLAVTSSQADIRRYCGFIPSLREYTPAKNIPCPSLPFTAIATDSPDKISNMNDGQTQVKQEAAQDKAVAPETLSYESLQPPHMTPSTSKQGESRNSIPSHLYNRLPKHCLLPDGTPDYLRLILTSRVYDLVQPSAFTSSSTGYKLTGLLL